MPSGLLVSRADRGEGDLVVGDAGDAGDLDEGVALLLAGRRGIRRSPPSVVGDESSSSPELPQAEAARTRIVEAAMARRSVRDTVPPVAVMPVPEK